MPSAIVFAINPTATGAAQYQIDLNGIPLTNEQMQNVPFGSQLTICWSGVTPSDGTFSIEITKPDGTQVWYDIQSPADSGIPFTVDQSGQWHVYWYGKATSNDQFEDLYAEAPLFVAPECSLAALGLTVAAFGAFVAFTFAKQRRL